jgi:hypothetical protein
MKKQKQKKTGAKKEEKEPGPESSKSEESAVQTEPPVQDVDGTKDEDGSDAKAPEEKVSDLNPSLHQRQPSLTLQSKMRSSSFRASSGGPLSPNYPPFSPDGDTAPDIYRKQALRIEELERENKRLAKEATDGERRWKKAEEELEELREAEDDTTSKKDISSGSSGELEKLVWLLVSHLLPLLLLIRSFRGATSQLSNVKTHNSKRKPHGPQDMALHPPCPSLRLQTSKRPSPPNHPPSNLWKSSSPLSAPTLTV